MSRGAAAADICLVYNEEETFNPSRDGDGRDGRDGGGDRRDGHFAKSPVEEAVFWLAKSQRFAYPAYHRPSPAIPAYNETKNVCSLCPKAFVVLVWF